MVLPGSRTAVKRERGTGKGEKTTTQSLNEAIKKTSFSIIRSSIGSIHVVFGVSDVAAKQLY